MTETTWKVRRSPAGGHIWEPPPGLDPFTIAHVVKTLRTERLAREGARSLPDRIAALAVAEAKIAKRASTQALKRQPRPGTQNNGVPWRCAEVVERAPASGPLAMLARLRSGG